MFDNFLDLIFPRNTLPRRLDILTAEELFLEVRHAVHDDDDVLAIFEYENELIKQAIWSLKFRGKKRFAKIFAQILYDRLLEKMSDLQTFSNFADPILIPIPLSKSRLRERGFNQSELIAEEMSLLDNNSSFIFKKNILIKIKNTPPQSRSKNKKERLNNLKNCFTVRNPHEIRKRNIILLDDVTTTGATIKEASKTLKRYGAKKIFVITVAH